MSKKGRPSTLQGPFGQLALKLGGIKNLARKLNVNERTIRYWSTRDRNPSGPAKILLENICSVHGIELQGDEYGHKEEKAN